MGVECDRRMNIPSRAANFYFGFPFVWCAVLAFGRSEDAMAFLAHWATLVMYPVLVFSVIYAVQRLRRHEFYWQRWFCWIGLVVPVLVLVHHHAG